MALFEELVEEGARADVTGWDFAWLDGRATEERPAWAYARQLGERLAQARASLDLETGGGEVLAEAPVLPPLAAATEGYEPNLVRATRRLHPRGVLVVRHPPAPPLPFADEAFGLVTSRHPAQIWWTEIARVLAPGGSYFAQHVGPASGFELVEHFLGPQPIARRAREPADEARAAEAAGLEVIQLRTARLRIEIFDVGAVVYLLRKLVWWVPGFAVDTHREALRSLHAIIEREGKLVAHSTRHLIEAKKRGTSPAPPSDAI